MEFYFTKEKFSFLAFIFAFAAFSISPFFTYLAGVAWLFVLIGSACLALTNRAAITPQGLSASLPWLVACAAATGIWLLQCWIWNEPLFKYNGNLNAALRLMLMALAGHSLAKKLITSESDNTRKLLGDTLAVACIASLVAISWVGFDRDKLSTYPIPWAVVSAMITFMLLSEALDGGLGRIRKAAWLLAVTAGMLAVVTSKTRGAYIIFPIALWLIVRHGIPGLKPRFIYGTGLALGALLITLASLPSDPFHTRLAIDEARTAYTTGDYNSSQGGRIGLYAIGWEAVRESPWIGVGARSRIDRIQHAGDTASPEEQSRWTHVRTLNHMHNQYLNNMVDGGLLSLSGLLILAAGLWLAAKRLHPFAPVASQQMNGLLLIHLTAGLSNVNFVHDYYSTMFGILVGCVFLLAQLHISQKPVSRALL